MEQQERSIKPLGRKAYGSIPHLPGSRLGPGDHHCHQGQAKIATEKARDRHDIIIVQEKLDGSNVAIAKINDSIYALSRAGYPAISSPYEQHHRFHHWVFTQGMRFYDLLDDGERICGEWLAQAHGTRYRLNHEPFVPFDMIVGEKRLPFNQFQERVLKFDFTIPATFHIGGPLPIEEGMKTLGKYGFHGAIDEVEGLMYRVERKGEVDFLTKYVRPNKQDGKYLPEYNNDQITWNEIKKRSATPCAQSHINHNR